MTLRVHITELVVGGVPLAHEERLGPAVEAALTRRLEGDARAAPPPRAAAAAGPEALADAIAASVHEAIEAAGGAP